MKSNESHPHNIDLPSSCCLLSCLSAVNSIGSSLIDFKKSDALSSLLHESSFIFWRIGRDTFCSVNTNRNNRSASDLDTPTKLIELLKHGTHTIVKHKIINLLFNLPWLNFIIVIIPDLKSKSDSESDDESKLNIYFFATVKY